MDPGGPGGAASADARRRVTRAAARGSVLMAQGPCWSHGRRRPDDHARRTGSRLVPHDPRRAAAMGARGRRLGGRLPGRHRAAPGRPRRGAGRGALVAAAPPARAPRTVRRGARRPGPGGGPGHDALAAPRLPRLLPGEHVRAGHPRRHRVERAGHPGNAVADRARLHRGREPRPRLGGRPARPVRPVPVDGRRRWRHPGLGLVGHPVCPPGGPRAGGPRAAPRSTASSSTRRRRRTRRWRRVPGWPGSAPTRCAWSTSTTSTRCDPTCWRPPSPTTRRPAGCRAWSWPRSARPARWPSTRWRPSPTSPRPPVRGCTSTGRWPARRPCAPSTAGCSTGSTGPTASCSTRTSGCSRRSTARASTWPTAPALLDALSILPEFLRNAASESGAVVDYRDWQVPLGRRFRALKLWFVLRWYGAEGLRHHVREHVRLAGELARAGRRRPALRAGGARPPQPGVPSPRRRRRRDRGPARAAQRHRPRLPHPHPPGRPLRDPGEHRRLDDRAAPCRRARGGSSTTWVTPRRRRARVHRAAGARR